MLGRQQAILDRLEQRGTCDYQELADAFGVSTMTIRRDVDHLARQGMLIKVLGGVQRATAPASLYESKLYARFAEHRAEKLAIARAALELIEGRQTVFLDGSTSCYELAKLLARERRVLTLVTNSALLCPELAASNQNMVVGIGGQYDPDSMCFTGPTTEEAAAKYFVDLAFVSTKGFVPDEGTFESNIANFHVKQIIARQAVKVILLVDHSKFDQRALSKVLDITQIHTVVTDDRTPAPALEVLRRHGREVHVAPISSLSASDAAHAV